VEEYLGCALTSISNGWGGGVEDLDVVAGWLVTLPQTFRFDLAVGFLSETEKAAATSLFDKVLTLGEKDSSDGSIWCIDSLLAAKEKYLL